MMNDYAKLYKYLWLNIYDDNEDHWLIRHEADAESWDKPTAIRQLQEFLA